jgi:hypothetical protein
MTSDSGRPTTWWRPRGPSVPPPPAPRVVFYLAFPLLWMRQRQPPHQRLQRVRTQRGCRPIEDLSVGDGFTGGPSQSTTSALFKRVEDTSRRRWQADLEPRGCCAARRWRNPVEAGGSHVVDLERKPRPEGASRGGHGWDRQAPVGVLDDPRQDAGEEP